MLNFSEETYEEGQQTATRWALLRTQLIWLYRGPVPEVGRGFRPAAQGFAALYLLRGNVKITCAETRKAVRARQGEWVILKPGPRFQDFSADAEVLSLRFRAQWPDGEQLFDEGLNLRLRGTQYPELLTAAESLEKAIAKLTRREFHDQKMGLEKMGFDIHVRIEQAYLDWLLVFYNTLLAAKIPPKLMELEDTRVRRAVRILQTWPLDQPLQETTLARELGMSRRQLERLLLEKLGVTSKKYLDRRKLDFALELLANDKSSIKEIAHRTGFRHSSSFCAWFRKHTGEVPSDVMPE